MEIIFDNGICIKEDDDKVILDPTRQTEVGVVTHGHMDHLVKGAHMTPHTLDIMEIRIGERRGEEMIYGFPKRIGGFDVVLHPAGHVFGSSMVSVGDVLYTGDFNPHGSLTCGKASPQNCETLIIETTYGKKDYSLPPKKEVIQDLLAWTDNQLEDGPVVFGAYEFGKAQEVIALLNSLGEKPYVPPNIARICEIYERYDVNLDYKLDEPVGDFTAVVSPGSIKKPLGTIARKARSNNGYTAYLSGWCAFFSFFQSMEIDAQFPLSDHAGFDELLDFVRGCDPQKVYTVHGDADDFADEVEKRFGIDAEPLRG